jgi:hypothetical protein
MQHMPDLHASDEEGELAEEAWWNKHPEQLDNEHPFVDQDLPPELGDELHQDHDVAGGGWDCDNLEPDAADAPQLQLQIAEDMPHAAAQEQVAGADPPCRRRSSTSATCNKGSIQWGERGAGGTCPARHGAVAARECK